MEPITDNKNSTIKSLEKELKQEREARKAMEERIETLFRAADKRQLAKLNPDAEVGKLCRISTYNGLVVTSWETESNVSEYRHNAQNEVNQVMVFYTEDEKKYSMPTEQFLKEGLVKVEVEIVETKERGGERFVTVSYNGKEYELPVKFIN